VVVYKVDRLTRSLSDFAKLVELFEAHDVFFRLGHPGLQHHDQHGRLTLNVLLSFAQFEREVRGERIRDKITASKRKGLWMGGPVPLGYRMRERKLVIHKEEAATVRLMFERYLAFGSLPALQRALRQAGIVSRRRRLSSGKVVGGVPFGNGALAHILRHRVYRGEINHKAQSHPGEHEPIVERALFEAVQAAASGARARAPRLPCSGASSRTAATACPQATRSRTAPAIATTSPASWPKAESTTPARCRAWPRPRSRPSSSAAAERRPMRPEARARLLEAIAKARRWLDGLLVGRFTSTAEIARHERCSERSVRIALSLAFLAPAIVRAAVDGRLPYGLTASSFSELPMRWEEQLQIAS
jgi:hypothetical protein